MSREMPPCAPRLDPLVRELHEWFEAGCGRYNTLTQCWANMLSYRGSLRRILAHEQERAWRAIERERVQQANDPLLCQDTHDVACREWIEALKCADAWRKWGEAPKSVPPELVFGPQER